MKILCTNRITVLKEKLIRKWKYFIIRNYLQKNKYLSIELDKIQTANKNLIKTVKNYVDQHVDIPIYFNNFKNEDSAGIFIRTKTPSVDIEIWDKMDKLISNYPIGINSDDYFSLISSRYKGCPRIEIFESLCLNSSNIFTLIHLLGYYETYRIGKTQSESNASYFLLEMVRKLSLDDVLSLIVDITVRTNIKLENSDEVVSFIQSHYGLDNAYKQIKKETKNLLFR